MGLVLTQEVSQDSDVYISFELLPRGIENKAPFYQYHATFSPPYP